MNGEELVKEVEEMIGAPTSVSSKESPSEEAPPSEEPGDETPPEEAPSEEPTEEPPAEEPPKEPPAEEKPPEGETREQALENQVAILLRRIEDLTQVQTETPAPVKSEEKPPEEKPPEAKPSEAPQVSQVPLTRLESKDFLGEQSIDDIIDSKEKLNELLNAVLSAATELSERRTYEKVLTSIPQLVMGYVNRKAAVDGLVGEFFEANEDLLPVRRTVAAISNEVHADNPDWTIEQVFKEAGVRTRKALGMPEAKTKPKPEGNNFDKPAFVDRSSSKTPPSVLTGTLQEEIDDLLNFDK